MITPPAVLDALRDGKGAWFGVTHACPDGQETEMRWEEDKVPWRWLVCRRCRFGVQLITRVPRGRSRRSPRDG